MLLTILLLSVSLSLDAFGVGLVYGLRKIKIPFKSKVIICFFSILYSGGALLLGNTLAVFLPPIAAKVVGLTILVLMGGWIILQGVVKNNVEPANSIVREEPPDPTLLTIVVKSLGITIHVVRNPVEFDMDHSGSIESAESLLLGLALSVDAIGVGIGSAMVGFHTFFIPICVGLTQWLLLYLGTYLGEHYAESIKVNEKLLSVLPGILLICLAIIRVY